MPSVPREIGEVQQAVKPLLAVAVTCLLAMLLVSVRPSGPEPLWPGSRYTQVDRQRALMRGMQFLADVAANPRHFSDWGPDLLWCFHSIAATAADARLRQVAHNLGHERAMEWRRTEAQPDGTNADDIANFVFGSHAADLLGARDDAVKTRLREMAGKFAPQDYLLFDPTREPPPFDVPADCHVCGAWNARGLKSCRRCGAALGMRSRYEVWYEALIVAYSGERYGVTLGARYVDVLRWLPVMRPYQAASEFDATLYAITHVVYTLNHYSVYRLPPACLPQEFTFLKANLSKCIASRDPEITGESLDSLRAFGLETGDPALRAGVEDLLSSQNPDGSWGDMYDRDIYNRYHATWTAIDGLREYRWRGTLLPAECPAGSQFHFQHLPQPVR